MQAYLFARHSDIDFFAAYLAFSITIFADTDYAAALYVNEHIVTSRLSHRTIL
jgi:hypothetical protein